ncbi:hypothetical protein LguiB_003027 [Lonicera macranthoides]
MGRVLFCPMVNIYSPSSPNHIFVGGKLYWFLQAEDTEVIPGSVLSVDEDENFTRSLREPPLSDPTRLAEREGYQIDS